MRLFQKCACVLLLCAFPATALADSYIEKAFGCRQGENPCVITYNPGGVIYEFGEAYTEALETNRLFVVDGICASACAMAMDTIRKYQRVCITPWAVFGFHKTTGVDFALLPYGVGVYKKRSDPPQSPDIDMWVRVLHKGYPTDGILWMPFSEAKHFWPVCRVAQ